MKKRLALCIAVMLMAIVAIPAKTASGYKLIEIKPNIGNDLKMRKGNSTTMWTNVQGVFQQEFDTKTVDLVYNEDYKIIVKNPDIVDVKPNSITAKKAGKTSVTYKGIGAYKKISCQVKVSVTGPADSFTIPKKINMLSNEMKLIEPTFYCDGVQTDEKAKIIYTPKDTTVCVVNNNGVITAKGVGKTTIIAKAPYLSVKDKKCTVIITSDKLLKYKSVKQKSDRITLKWNKKDEAIAYRLEKKIGSKYAIEVLIDDKNKLSYVDKDVTPGVTYTYMLSYVYNQNGSDIYGEVNTKTVKFVGKPSKPKLVSAKIQSKDGYKVVQVNWRKIKDANNVVVQIKKANSKTYKNIGTYPALYKGLSIPYASKYFSTGENSIRIYSYKSVGGKKVKSKMSNVVKVKY